MSTSDKNRTNCKKRPAIWLYGTWRFNRQLPPTHEKFLSTRHWQTKALQRGLNFSLSLSLSFFLTVKKLNHLFIFFSLYIYIYKKNQTKNTYTQLELLFVMSVGLVWPCFLAITNQSFVVKLGWYSKLLDVSFFRLVLMLNNEWMPLQALFFYILLYVSVVGSLLTGFLVPLSFLLSYAWCLDWFV